MRVHRAYWGFGRIDATMPPDAAATIVGTMGRSQVAVMVERCVSWTYLLIEVKIRVEEKVGGRPYITKGI
jgi:hypothetical protein